MHDELLVRAFNAYRQGLRKQDEIASGPLGRRDFDSLTFLGAIGRIPLRERSRLRRLQRSCGRGLEAARQGRLEEAGEHYRAARQDLDPLAAVSRLAWLLATSCWEAGGAYLDFRRHETESARRRLDRAMDADLELEREGIPVLQINRLQQGHNLARMDFRLGRRDAAIELTGSLVAYMEREIAALPYHHDWRPAALGTRELLRSMIGQVLGETAGRVAGEASSPAEWRLLIRAARLKADPDKAILPQAQYALRAQAALLEQDYASYLRSLERFFLLGIRGLHTLWYALLGDLLSYCRQAGSGISLRAAETLLRDAGKWQGLPPHLRHRFESSSIPLVA